MRHSSFLEVNLDYLHQNFKRIQSLAPSAEILPMVKANAYGNGIVAISKFLVDECGVKTLGCATLGEALYITQTINLKSEFLIFSDTEIQNKEMREAYLNLNIKPVIHQKADLHLVLHEPSLAKLPLIIKMNTGMNRLGLLATELEEYLPLLKKRGINHLMTHFARSGELIRPGDKSQRQFEEFQKIKKMLADAGVAIEKTSVSNSGAIEQNLGATESYVRPGLMLYGPPSVLDPILWNGYQVSRLVTKILSTSQIKKGTPIGYGVNVADKDCLIAVIPMGYGDGMVSYGSGTKITINGWPGKIFGRISMDMAFIQFDPEAESFIKNEDVVELWNHDNRMITDLAIQNKTIPYQLMCGISSRVPRIYKLK